MCSGIGCVSQPVLFRSSPKVIADYTRFDSSDPPFRIYLKHSGKILRRIDNDGDVNALATHWRAAPSGQNGRARVATHTYALDDIIHSARNDDSDRHLAIIGRV